MNRPSSRFALLFAPLLATGCAELISVERSLADQASRGVALAKASLDERDQLAQADMEKTRRALDAAFDDDVRSRAEALDAAWVIAHRQAYAVGVDALHTQSTAFRERSAVDRDNLAATEEALRRLRAIQDAKLNLIPNLKGDVR